jgi:1-acyl-sn-glycerol-3-phosphate acyltransferase
MSIMIWSVVAKIIKVFYVKAHIEGVQKVLNSTNAVVVANHLGSFGPLALMSSLIHKLFPWVVQEVTNLKDCAAYIRKDFVEKELKLRSFVGRELSRIIGRICVRLMSDLKAVPVYRRSREIYKTFEMSLNYLKSKRALLIFPENDQSKKRDDLCMLNTGFIRMAQWLYATTNKVLSFYPVAINKKVRAIRVGEPIHFDPNAPFGEERKRIKEYLERSISGMYRALERENQEARASKHPHKEPKIREQAA